MIMFPGEVGFVIRHNFSSDRHTFWNLLIHPFIREIRQLAARFNATQTDDHCFTYKKACMGELKSRMKPIIHIHLRFQKIGQVALVKTSFMDQLKFLHLKIILILLIF
jgi:hypothetical protein